MSERKRQLVQRCTWVLLGVYLMLLCYFLLLWDQYGRAGGQIGFRYNLVPFREIQRFLIYWRKVGILSALMNMAGNIVGFMPLGFLVPILRASMRSPVKIFFTGFFISLAMELLQLILRAGIFDVDDLILNTLGCMAGYLVFIVFRRLIYGKKI